MQFPSEQYGVWVGPVNEQDTGYVAAVTDNLMYAQLRASVDAEKFKTLDFHVVRMVPADWICYSPEEWERMAKEAIHGELVKAFAVDEEGR